MILFKKIDRDRSPNGPSAKTAFSLIEVILSLGIMSVALLIVFGVLTPFLSQTGEVVETATVNRITNRIAAEIEQLSYPQIISILNQNIDLYSSREGDKFALANDPELETKLPEQNRHFAIRLARNLDLSPVGKDNTAGFVAFQIRIERIIHAPDGTVLQSPLDQTLAIFNSAVIRTES